jgi:hypothetical protein
VLCVCVYTYIYIYIYIYVCVCVFALEHLLGNHVEVFIVLCVCIYVCMCIPYVQNTSPRACGKKDFWPTLNRTSQYVGALPVQIVSSDNKT